MNLGPLSKVKVWHDNSGLKSAWNLDRIEIQDKLAEENYVFPCNRWLATSEDDGQICRELVVVDERARKLERRRTLSRKASVISNVDGVDLEAKGLQSFISFWHLIALSVVLEIVKKRNRNTCFQCIDFSLHGLPSVCRTLR